MLTNRIAPAFAAVFAGREIDEFAAKTPFQLEEVTRRFIKLKTLGLASSERALVLW